MDEARLRLKRLPHVGIERTLGYVTENLDFFVFVTLAQNPPLALLNIARAPRGVKMMERGQPALDVGARAHLFR